MKIIGRYKTDTPLFWRKLGDACLGVFTFGTGIAIANDVDEMAYTLLAFGLVGKFLTDLFKK